MGTDHGLMCKDCEEVMYNAARNDHLYRNKAALDRLEAFLVKHADHHLIFPADDQWVQVKAKTVFEYEGPRESIVGELTSHIAKALVDKPEQVQVCEVNGEQTVVVELKVAKEDLGKVIGKQGRMARALRTIIGAASAKTKKRSILEIIE